MNAHAATAVRKRVRLPPDVRSQQLLDAALIEFSRNGFAGTRIEDIAHRAGLSKSGVYAHYSGKEEIFEALLDRVFAPLEVTGLSLDRADAVERFVEDFIDKCYARLLDPTVIAMSRLMIAESVRMPELVQRWYREILIPFHQAQARVLEEAVERGLVRRSPLTDNFALAHAPALYTMIMAMVYQEGPLHPGRSSLRDAHRQMMLALLKAP